MWVVQHLALIIIVVESYMIITWMLSYGNDNLAKCVRLVFKLMD
jgi:hypothetical protein